MKRRQFIQYSSAGIVTSLGLGLAAQDGQAQGGGVTIEALGHMCFRFSGGGLRVLCNPFKSQGCTAGLPAPRASADLVLISSQLADEGAVDLVPGNPKLLFEAGNYEVSGARFQGISMDHDKNEGNRFGKNIAWRWNHGGVSILHLGGAAAPITLEQKILIGSPDVVIIPVGGGPKSYGPEDAAAALKVLNPSIVIPTQYRTSAAKSGQCDLVEVEAFLKQLPNAKVRRPGSSLSLSSGGLSKDGMTIQLLN
jgi:L-ascorbate metabolism protein UlaG (beta-lactamase superfamily)